MLDTVDIHASLLGMFLHPEFLVNGEGIKFIERPTNRSNVGAPHQN